MLLNAQGRPIELQEVLNDDGEAELSQFLSNLRESWSRLEFELEQAGWQRENREGAEEPSRQALRTASAMARLAWLKNPLIRRAVDLQASYVYAQGLNVKAADDTINDVIQAFLDDPQNSSEITGHQPRTQKERELTLDGNLFLVFFVNKSTGAVKVSTIPGSQIDSIMLDPENAKRPRYYERKWTVEIVDEDTGARGLKGQRAFYPDWRYVPKAKRPKIGEVPVMWDAPICHVKVGGFSDWRFGFPEVEVARPYATAYKDFLTDWATIVKSLGRFAWKYLNSASAAETAAVKAKLGSTAGSGGAGTETRPPPVVGSVAVLPEGKGLDPIKTQGATMSTEDGRQLRVQAISALGFADHFFGDTAQGTLATAKSLDRPTELRIKDRQGLWTNIFRDICSYVLLCAVKAPSGPLRGLGQVADPDGTGPELERVEWNDGVDASINVDWPPIVEQDLKDYVAALMQGAPKLPTELVSKLLMVALGVDDIDEWLDQLELEAIEDPGELPETDGDDPAPEEMLAEALRKLDHRLVAIGGQNGAGHS